MDHTSTNRTLDGDNSTFLIREGGKGVYADFSHDNDMMTVFAALELYNSTTLLLPTDTRLERNDERLAGYAAAYAVPFGARMFVEKMTCGSGNNKEEKAGKEEGKEKEKEREMVRVILNDRVIPLQSCGADELGRCELSRWIESLEFARSGGRWEECFTDDDDSVGTGKEKGSEKHKAKIEADGSDHAEDVKQDAKAKHEGKIEADATDHAEDVMQDAKSKHKGKIDGIA